MSMGDVSPDYVANNLQTVSVNVWPLLKKKNLEGDQIKPYISIYSISSTKHIMQCVFESLRRKLLELGNMSCQYTIHAVYYLGIKGALQNTKKVFKYGFVQTKSGAAVKTHHFPFIFNETPCSPAVCSCRVLPQLKLSQSASRCGCQQHVSAMCQQRKHSITQWVPFIMQDSTSCNRSTKTLPTFDAASDLM